VRAFKKGLPVAIPMLYIESQVVVKEAFQDSSGDSIGRDKDITSVFPTISTFEEGSLQA
jgi:hypothetical protein